MISVVIPCYQSHRWIKQHIQNIIDCLQHQPHFEIILVNDGSRDKTWESLKELVLNHTQLTGINLAKRVGQTQATLCGIQYSQGEWVFTLDDDGQHSPKYMTALLEASAHSTHIDAHIACYLDMRSWPRKILSNVYHRLMVIRYELNPDIHFTAFRLLQGDLARQITSKHYKHPAFSVLLSAHTKNIQNVVVKPADSYSLKHRYTLWKLLKLAANLLLNNPLTPAESPPWQIAEIVKPLTQPPHSTVNAT